MWESRALQEIRLWELARVIPYFSDDARILEVGAGNGWQARELAERGYEIKAIDYAHEHFKAMRQERVFPVQDYDGRNIPYLDHSVDIVFTSNVLEHIADVESFLAEIQRVLKPGGIAVHILPTATWRVWTTVTHYVLLLRKVLCRVKRSDERGGQFRLSGGTLCRARRRSAWNRIRWWMIPERHGEKGNFVTEIYYFSRWRWRNLFGKTGLRTLSEIPGHVFYSGVGLFGKRLSLEDRRCLSRLLGSSCRGWILSGR